MDATRTENEATGWAVFAARKFRRATADDLATAISKTLGEDYSANTITKMENGYRDITVRELKAIAKALVWPLDWLTNPPLPDGTTRVDSSWFLPEPAAA